MKKRTCSVDSNQVTFIPSTFESECRFVVPIFSGCIAAQMIHCDFHASSP